MSPTTVSTRLQKIAEMAREAPDMVITTLAHHIDIEFLKEAYRRTRKDGATGVDEQTAGQYAENLDENLESLLNRFKSGSYKAPPVRRVYIPKGDGKRTRPIGIPTFEDKVLQRAVTMLLEAIYEQGFLDCSYGFRPGRSPHQALDALWKGLMGMKGGWVIEVDIRSYFDRIDHQYLREFLDKRVRDGVLRRTIDKWLKAGVLENGQIEHPETGSPQGGVISPILSNIFLHEVLDVWFEEVVKPRLKGKAFLIRFADDSLIGCASESDASRIRTALERRFAKYGLEVHPEKTRVVDFRRPPSKPGSQKDEQGRRPRSFDMLGFTHFWGKSRQGNWVVKRKTAKDRLCRSLRKIAEWCKVNRYADVAWQHNMLVPKIRGHYAYYGITGNGRALQRFLDRAKKIWFKWLLRRSQRSRSRRFFPDFLLSRFPLPPAVVVHSIYNSP